MDTSNRLEYLLGDIKVSAKDITIKEWSEIVGLILSNTKPYFKYSHGFRSIEDTVKALCEASKTIPIINFPDYCDKINNKTRVLMLVSRRTEGNETTEFKFFDEYFFLTQKGEWIICDVDYVLGDKTEDKIDRIDIIEYTQAQIFSSLSYWNDVKPGQQGSKLAEKMAKFLVDAIWIH